MGIQNFINSILNEPMVDKWRQSIVGAIEQVYKDATTEGNANMEVSRARGSFPVLNDRLDNADSEREEATRQLAHKAEQSTALSLQSQVDSLIISSGQADNAEISQARTDDQGNVFPVLKGNLDNIYTILENNVGRISFGDWVSGAIESSGFENTLNTFIRTSGFHTFETGETVDITPLNGYKIRIASYEENDTFISVSSFYKEGYKFYPVSGRQYKLSIGYDDATAITPSDATNVHMQSEVTVKTKAKGAEYIDVSPNLINPRAVSHNAVINASTGAVESSSTYGVTDFIPLAPGQAINPTRYRNYALYDASGNFLFAEVTETTTNTTVVNNTFPKLAYIRFTIRNAYLNEAMASYSPISQYEKYGLKMPDLNVGEMNFTEDAKQYILSLLDSSTNSLAGKTLYSFGTSILAGHHEGVSFPDYIAENNNMTYTKYAVNGNVVIGEASGSILYQIANASAAIPDFILLDSWANNAYTTVTDDPAQLGSITEGYDAVLDTNTYCGAMEQICKTLQLKYNGAKVIHIGVYKLYARDLGAQTKLAELTKQIVEKWSGIYLDLFNGSNYNSFLLEHREKYSYNNAGETSGGNGTHLNELGNKEIMVPVVTAKMKSLV